MAYVDPQSVHNPSTGAAIPAAWGDAVRDSLQYVSGPPMVILGGAASSTNNNTYTDIAMSTEIYDPYGMHSGTNRFIVVPDAGVYLVNAVVDFDANTSGSRTVQFVNGSTTFIGQQVNASGTGNTVLSCSRNIVCAAGDIVKVQARQISGGVLNATCREFSATWVSRN